MASTRPRLWTVVLAIVFTPIAVALAQAAGIGLLAVWCRVDEDSDWNLLKHLMKVTASSHAALLLNGLSQLATAGIAITAAWLSPQPLTRRLGLTRPKLSVPEVGVLMLGTIVPSALGVALASRVRSLAEDIPSADVDRVIQNHSSVFIIYISLVPAIAEELLFRGYIQLRLLERWPGWLAVVVSSMLFAVQHVGVYTSICALATGLWFGVVAWRTRSVIPSMLCHMFINLLWAVVNSWRSQQMGSDVLMNICYVALVIIGCCAFLFSIYILVMSCDNVCDAH